MQQFVYAANDGIVMWGDPPAPKQVVAMRPNEIWFADDPFVLARPDLFSATPLVVHSTEGRDAPPVTPIVAQKPELATGGVVPSPVVVTVGGTITTEVDAAAVRRSPRARRAARA